MKCFDAFSGLGRMGVMQRRRWLGEEPGDSPKTTMRYQFHVIIHRHRSPSFSLDGPVGLWLGREVDFLGHATPEDSLSVMTDDHDIFPDIRFGYWTKLEMGQVGSLGSCPG